MNRVKKTTLLKCSEDLFLCIQSLLNRVDAAPDDLLREVIDEWVEAEFTLTIKNNDILQGLSKQKEIT